MKRKLVCILLAVCLTLSTRAVHAVEFGNWPVKIVAGFGPGGVTDFLCRLLAFKMSESLGVSVVVENMPAASGLTAASTVARAKPDGHTLLIVGGQNAASATLFKSLPYKLSDLIPVSMLGVFDFVFVNLSTNEIASLGGLMSAAKQKSGIINVGSISTGTGPNLVALLFGLQSKLKFQIVPYRTTGEVVAALLSGQIQAAVDTVPGVLDQIEAGKLRALAVSSDPPLGLPKGVPSVAESGGLPNFNLTGWNGFVVPAGTPPAIVQLLNEEVAKALADPDTRSRLLAVGIVPKVSTPEEMQKIFDADLVRWRNIIHDAGIPTR